MNTENINQQTVQNNIPPVAGTNIPPVPEMTPPSESRRSLLRIFVIILAVLVLAGGALAFYAVNQNNQPDTQKSDSLTTIEPTVDEDPSGLKMAVSDDPEILEQEANDINLENLDEELTAIDEDSAGL